MCTGGREREMRDGAWHIGRELWNDLSGDKRKEYRSDGGACQRAVSALSGGQRQRVWIAMALAQQTDILLLDEPTTYLDIAYQVEILDLLTDLNRRRNTTIVMVLHDINLSARYADYIFALRKGKLIKQGSPDEVITSELIDTVFGLDCEVIKDPVSNSPFIIPKGRHYVNV